MDVRRYQLGIGRELDRARPATNREAVDGQPGDLFSVNDDEQHIASERRGHPIPTSKLTGRASLVQHHPG